MPSLADFCDFGTVAPLLPAAPGIDAFSEDAVAIDVNIDTHDAVARRTIVALDSKSGFGHLGPYMHILDRLDCVGAAERRNMPRQDLVDREVSRFRNGGCSLSRAQRGCAACQQQRDGAGIYAGPHEGISFGLKCRVPSHRVRQENATRRCEVWPSPAALFRL